MNTLDPMSKLKYYFQAEIAREQIREDMRKDMQMPLVVSDHKFKEDEINSYTTVEMFTLNNMLAHTKELGVKKGKKWNYITDLFTRGIKVIKNRKG